MKRHDGRAPTDLRPISIERGFLRQAAGSALIRCGGTAVLVSAQVSSSVPPFLAGTGRGWLTAEYAMLPGSTPSRKSRGPDGRSTEIQRLIGRSLRAVVDLDLLGSMTVNLDADVLEADGGTRTAAITGAYVALIDALSRRLGPEKTRAIVRESVAAVSVGMVAGNPLLDLDYREDSTAEVDLNVVQLGSGGLVEVQGTGEGGTFTRGQLDTLLDLAEAGLGAVRSLQRQTLGDHWPVT